MVREHSQSLHQNCGIACLTTSEMLEHCLYLKRILKHFYFIYLSAVIEFIFKLVLINFLYSL